MKAVKAKITGGLNHGSIVNTCDNSGAKKCRIISIKLAKTVRRRKPVAKVGDLVNVSVVVGDISMRKQVVPAIVVRQKRAYRRLDGTRIKFEDNAVLIVKDEKGNPKGTIFKGPIAKEAADRWPPISKVAPMVI